MTLRRPAPPLAAVSAAATAVVMLIVGLVGLDRHSMWGDEAVTSYAAHLRLRQLFHLLGHLDAVHGLYYLVMHGVVKLGGGEVLLRLPSVLGMAAAVGLVTAVGTRLSGSTRVGVAAGLVLAVLPIASQYAQDARSYGLVTAGALAASAAFLRAAEHGRPPAPTTDITAATAAATGHEWRPWLYYGLALVITGYLNELSLLIVLAHGSTLLLSRATKAGLIRWAVTVAVSLALVAPLLYVSARETVAVTQFSRPPLSQLGSLYREFFGPAAIVCVVTILCAIVALLPESSLRAAWTRRDRITLPMFALPLLVVPPVVLFLESRVHQPLFIDRYLLYSCAGAALLIADGAVRIGQVVARHSSQAAELAGVPAVLVIALVLVLQLPQQRTIRSARGWSGDYGSAARYVHKYARPGDGVEFIGRNFRNDRLGYPREFATVTDLALARSPQASGTLRGVYKPKPEIRLAMLTYLRIWVVGFQSRLHTGVDAYQLSVLAKHFVMVKDKRYHGVEIRLYERK